MTQICATTDTNDISSDSGSIRCSLIDTSSLPATFNVATLIAHVEQLGDPSYRFALGLYADDTNKPGDLIVATDGTNTPVLGENIISVSAPVITNTDKLWLGFQTNAPGGGTSFKMEGKTSGGTMYYNSGHTFPDFPNPFGTSTYDSQMSHVCLTDGGTPPPTSGATRLPPPPLIARF